ncbi:uncharacterized protein LOC144110034 [Amblyomma americanum]
MQNQMGQQSAPSTSSAATGGAAAFGRTPSTTVILNLSREKLNRGGARPIFPSACALPTLQANFQRMQMAQGMGGGMQQSSLGQMQALMQQQSGLGQQRSMAGMLPGMQGMQGSMGGGLQGMPGMQGMAGMQQSSPSIMGQASIGGMPPGNVSIGLNMGLGGMGGMGGMGGLSGMGSMGSMGMQPQQQQMSNLLAQQQQVGMLGQQSNMLSALQSQQGRMLGQQSSGQMMPMGSGMMNQLTGTMSSNPQLGMLSASLMTSPQLQQQKSQSAFSGMMAASRSSKPMLQAMETLQGGSPGVQGISGSPALTGTPAPIVMSQPITSAGLAPQMQHLLLKGMPGYNSTLVLILVPQD